METLHINGWLGINSDSAISVSEEKNANSWDMECIAKKVMNFADTYAYHREYRQGLGGEKAYIEDVNLRIYVTDKECTLEEAECALVDKLEGGVEVDIALEGYSEYTITGYSVEDFSIGNHNLEYELREYLGKYIHFVMEYEG